MCTCCSWWASLQTGSVFSEPASCPTPRIPTNNNKNTGQCKKRDTFTLRWSRSNVCIKLLHFTYLNNSQCGWSDRIREVSTRRWHTKEFTVLKVKFTNKIITCWIRFKGFTWKQTKQKTQTCLYKCELTLLRCWRCLLSLDFPGTSHVQHAHRRKPVWRPGKPDTHCLQPATFTRVYLLCDRVLTKSERTETCTMKWV